MNYKKLDGKVIITNSYAKNDLIKSLSNEDSIYNIKIFTLDEFKKKYFFDYDKKTIYYISTKYNCIQEIAKIYLENLYYIDETKKYTEEKLNFLKGLKKDLINKDLLITNNLFKKYIKNQNIVLYNLKYEDKFILNILNSFKNVESIDLDVTNDKAKLYKFNNMESEVSFVASQIVDLIKKGTPINKIKLANVKEDYVFCIYKYFKMFNIPINSLIKKRAKGTYLVKLFKKNFKENISETIDILSNVVENEADKKLLKKIINIVNSFSFSPNINDVKDLLFEDIDNIVIEEEKLVNAVEIINFNDEIIKDDEYVFLLNFNQGSIPNDYKDEDYLNDLEKTILNVNTSIENNKTVHKQIENKIKSVKNLFVTYSVFNLTGEQYISSVYSNDLFIEGEASVSKENSDAYNKLMLTSHLDEFYKFNTINDDLINLYNHYNNFDYGTFKNDFKGLNKKEFNSVLNKGLKLSYTNLNDFYNCQFKYYVKNILKIEKYEETFSKTLGNIFHYVLSKCFDEKFDFECSFNKALENEKYEISESDSFFLEILKEELKTVIEILHKQKDKSSIYKSYYEKRVELNIDKNIILKGFIDKIMVAKDANKDVCFIVDYKTGEASNNLNNLYYGLDMQLPIYTYLVKNIDDLKDSIIGGFYLQKVVSTNKDMNEKEKDLMLNGYTNQDSSIINLIDKDYAKSTVIKGMKTTKEGNLYSTAKTLSTEEINEITNLAKQKIDLAIEKIKNAEFDINPKKVGKDLVGCKYCSFKDLCYKKNEDIVELKEVKYKDFLGGDGFDKVD